MFPGVDMAKQVCITEDGTASFVPGLGTIVVVDRLVTNVVPLTYRLATCLGNQYLSKLSSGYLHETNKLYRQVSYIYKTCSLPCANALEKTLSIHSPKKNNTYVYS